MIFDSYLRVPFAVSRHQPQSGPASWRQEAQLRYFSRPFVSWAGGRHCGPGCSPSRLGRRATRSSSNGGGSMVISSDSWTVPTLLLSTTSSLDNNYCTEFQNVPEESMHKILQFPEHSMCFNKLPRVLNQLNGFF